MPPISVLIKPASSGCNLACKYCFYYDVSNNREVTSYGKMSDETLECIVQKVMEKAEYNCSFAFQGGEPTLAGLEFYKELIKYQRKYAKPGVEIHNAIQTNGILITKEWAEFLGKHKFLVGLSLDGHQAINDRMRINQKGEGTFDQIMEATKLFARYKVDYNILTVVTKPVAENIKEIYSFYIQHNFRYMQFIPCLDPIQEERGKHNYSLTPKLYEKFLKQLFDEWYNTLKRGEFAYVRFFENIIQILLGYYPEACGMMGVCTNQYVIEADASVYPCDFYVMDDYKIGNMINDTFKEIEENRINMNFIGVSKAKDSGCTKCKWYKLCHGGCRRDRDTFCGEKLGRNYFCQAYKGFYKYTYERFQEIASEISKNM
ncbi:MAG: anaerobic sulfatase maturase [Cellulosilyticaceae bacterium]